jgi:hypothetical protein
MLKKSLVSTLGVAFTCSGKFPTENVFIKRADNRGRFYCFYHCLSKKRVNELIIPNLLVLQPKISDLGCIRVVCELSYKSIVNVSPNFAPGCAPYGYTALGYLVERVGFNKKRKHFKD